MLVQQNVHLMLAMSGYAYVLTEGSVEVEATLIEVARNPDIRKTYLGM